MSISRWRDERGVTIPILALALPVLILMVAFAIDLGRQRADRRLAQSGADVVALDMVRVAGGRTYADIIADEANVVIALNDSALRNDFVNTWGAGATGNSATPLSTPRITYIEWSELADNEDGRAFKPLVPGGDADGDGIPDLDEVPTAVRITAERNTDYFFQPNEGSVTRLAIATYDSRATFQLGTRLISIDSAQSALLNSVLGGALGGALGVSVLDYQGLIGANINLFDLATQMGFGSPEEMADASVNAQDFYLAGGQVMTNNGNTAAASVFNQSAAAVDGSTTLDMGTLMDFEQGGPDDEANASVDAFSILTGSAYAINGTSTLSVPSLGVTIPNVGSSSLELTVTEQMVTKSGRVGDSASTRQASAVVSVNLNPTVVAGLSITGTVQLRVELAGGTGTIANIDCGTPALWIGLAPRPVRTIGTIDLDVTANIPLLGPRPVADVSGTAVDVTTQGTSNGAVFDYTADFLPDVGTGTMAAANPTTLGVAGAAGVTTGNVNLLGIPLGPSAAAIAAGTNALLNPILAGLDAFVVNNLSTQLGLNVGGADIGAVDMTCRGVKLVG